MRLLLSVFLLIALPMFGAVPSYTAFIGTNGITVSSNPPLGKIIIGGSGSAAPGGDTYSVQINTNDNAYFGDTLLQYFPGEFGYLSLRSGSQSNVLTASGIGSYGAHGFQILTSNGTPRWLYNIDGHYVPFTSNAVDQGSFLLPVRTNWVNDVVVKHIQAIGPNPGGSAIVSDVGGNTFYASNSPLYISYSNTPSDTVTIDTVTGDSSGIALRRSRGSFAAPADVQNTDQIGYTDYRGYSGTKFFNLASIAAHVDGVPVSGQTPPGRLVFSAAPLNGSADERMRINSSGQVIINTIAGVAGIGSSKLAVRQTDGVADYAAFFRGATNSGGSYGIKVEAGTTSVDSPLWISTADNATLLFRVKGNGDAYVMASLGVGDSTPDATVDIEASTPSQFITATTGTSTTHTDYINTGGAFRIGRERNIGGGLIPGTSAYAGVLAVRSAHDLQFGTDTTLRLTISSAGHVLFGADNSYDVGASGANRPRNLFVGGYANLSGTVRLSSANDGDLAIANNAGAGFDTLQFGGTDTSVPGLTKTNAHLKVSNGFGNLTTATNALWFQGQYWSGAITTTNVTQQAGKVRLAAGSQTYNVANNHVTTSSIVVATINSDDTTATSVKAIVTAGNIALKTIASATADCDISWFIVSTP